MPVESFLAALVSAMTPAGTGHFIGVAADGAVAAAGWPEWGQATLVLPAMLAWAGDIFLLLGATFVFLGALGLFRMPDVYTRLQAGTKAATLGALSLLVGVFFHVPEWWPKLLLVGLLILLTAPVGSSTIARAARLAGQEPWLRPVQDDRPGGHPDPNRGPEAGRASGPGPDHPVGGTP